MERSRTQDIAVLHCYPLHPKDGIDVTLISKFQVAAAEYIKTNAPEGTLATLTGLYGGAHNGFGKGCGGLIGGIFIEQTKSTHKAFRYFGIAAASFAALFTLFSIVDAWRKRGAPQSGVKKAGVDRSGDGEEESTEDTDKKQEGERDSFIAKDDREQEMLEFGRESPVGSHSP